MKKLFQRVIPVAASVLYVAGCTQQNRPLQPMSIRPADNSRRAGGSDAQSAWPEIPPSRNASAPDEPTFNAPDALARKTAAYSAQMQSMLNDKQIDKSESLNSKTLEPKDRPAAPVNPPSVSQRSAAALEQSKQQHKPEETLSPTPIDTNDNAGEGKTASGKEEARANTAAAVVPANTNPAPAAGVVSPANTSELAAKLARRVKEFPRDVSAHLDYQLIRFLMDEPVPDLTTLASLPTEDRELISCVIDGLSNLRSALRQDNNMLLSKKVRPILEMADRLRAQADLSISTIALCTKVRTFGDYEPIESPRFAAGKTQEVILYCEIENFSSTPDEHQLWQTKLSQEVVLYTENGLHVWNEKSPRVEDSSRKRRHDLYTVVKLRLPATLAVGRYFLKVTIVDQQANRVAEATLPIIIAAQ